MSGKRTVTRDEWNDKLLISLCAVVGGLAEDIGHLMEAQGIDKDEGRQKGLDAFERIVDKCQARFEANQ